MKPMKPRISILLTLLVAAVTLVSCSGSDPVITTKVKAQLMANETVRPYKLEVTTNAGVVTITGNIDSQEAKDRALEIAKQTKGVIDVVDMIAVRTASGTGEAPDPDRTLGETLDDASITLRVKARLLDDPLVKGLKIDVDTREGVVFLTGSVQSPAEKDKAIQLAKDTKGVKDVKVNLSVSSS